MDDVILRPGVPGVCSDPNQGAGGGAPSYTLPGSPILLVEPGNFVLSGSDITQWTASGIANHLTVGTNAPSVDAVNTLGGRPTAHFDRANAECLTRATFIGGDLTEGVICVVARPTSFGTKRTLFDGEAGGRRWAIDCFTDDTTRIQMGGSWAASAGTIASAGWHVFLGQYYDAGVENLYVDDFTSIAATGSTGSDVLRGLHLGADNVPANYWDGQIGWGGLWPAGFSGADLTQLGNYLNQEFAEVSVTV